LGTNALAQAGSYFPERLAFKIHTQTFETHSQEALTVATMSAIFLSLMAIPYTTFQYATATFKVLNAYSGWSNVNYVLNDVKNPVRTLKIAGPLGLGICAFLYLFANISYFA
jgi:amino acid transporter